MQKKRARCDRRIVIATGNQSKIKEMTDPLLALGFDVKLQSDFGISEVKETGTTFFENAIIKARHAARVTGIPAIADDSGLEVDILNGRPGVYSSRYSGVGATDESNIEMLLNDLRSIPGQQRTARFVCVLAFMYHADDPMPLVCHGKWEGKVSREPEGENGFGYDPVFFVESERCTSAQLDPKRKKRLSHRGQALRSFCEEVERIC